MSKVGVLSMLIILVIVFIFGWVLYGIAEIERNMSPYSLCLKECSWGINKHYQSILKDCFDNCEEKYAGQAEE